MTGKITKFQNILNTSTPFYISVSEAVECIRRGDSKELIEAIRKEKDKVERNLLKKELPAVCFSGEFSKRSDNAIMKHSGIICLDFDGFSTVKRMKEVRGYMEQDSIVYSVFTSPSGDGIKVLVKIPEDIDNHKLYFKALEEYFNLEEFDKSCKNISRVCYESYDPKIYVNPESELWDRMIEEEIVEVAKTPQNITLSINDDNEIMSRLMKWWNKEYGLKEGEKNNNLFILASAMNKFGIHQSTASLALSQFDQGKTKIRTEIEALVKSAYRVEHEHNTRMFEDTDKIHALRRKVKRGESAKELREELVDEGIKEKEAKAIIKKIEEQAKEDIQVFWSKTEKGKVSIVHNLFKEFLQDNGFYKFYPEGSKNFIFVHKVSNRVKNTTELSIKDFVLGYLEARVEDPLIWNFFADKTRYFKEDFLGMLDSIEIQFVEDTLDKSYLFYKNVAVLVTRDKVITMEYTKLPGWIWEDQMINRDFVEGSFEKGEFKKLIHNISGDDSQRIKSMESTIGFLIHGYKPVSYCPAVILNDEIISENPEGGTGKGIFTTSISEIRKTASIDGKMFSFDKSFPYQTVQQDTQVLAFDDVQKTFNFERLFSVITQGITLEKKNKDAIHLPPSKSPKIIITTNYALRGSGESFERRKWELEFKHHYKKGFTPREEFGHDLFTEWNESEWVRFDNYMISNLQGYLDVGFVKSEFKNLRARKFIASTNHDFHEFMSDDNLGYRNVDTKYHCNDVFNKFTDDYPDYAPKSKRSISRGAFKRWLVAWGEYRFGTSTVIGRDSLGNWVEFKKAKEKKSQTKMGI